MVSLIGLMLDLACDENDFKVVWSAADAIISTISFPISLES